MYLQDINAFLLTLKAKCNQGSENHVFVMPSYLAVLWERGYYQHWLNMKANYYAYDKACKRI